MRPNPKFLPDLVTFTEEILNAKLHFLCSDSKRKEINDDCMFGTNKKEKPVIISALKLITNFIGNFIWKTFINYLQK